MSDLFEAAAQAEREAVRLLLPRLRSDEAIQRRHLNDAMTKAVDRRGKGTPVAG